VIACGGINGNLNKVRENWDRKLSPAPKPLLNGSHPSADGHLHDEVQAMGGNITHLNWMWNYAAGIHKKNPEFPGKGLSLIPAKTALWLDAHGKRIGPEPMISCFDTHNLCHRIANLPHQYSWQIMNRKIAEKEIAVSGSDVNPSIRDRKFLTFMNEILFGNKRLIDYLINNSDDVLVADTLPELVQKMNQHTPDVEVSIDKIKESLTPYERQLKAGPRFHNDDQLRRLLHLRNWPGDRLRTCQSQPILDTKAGPLIAIKASIISRKSMGGIQTNLSSQVLTPNDDVIEGLYAIGEAAGFGGGGISGNRSLEGTFLAGSILTARRASEDLSK
jgi:predicted oxidoreductase